jgi:hypothetical protein
MALTFLAVFTFAVAAAPLRQRNDLRALWSDSQPPGVDEVALQLKDLRRRGRDLLQGVSPSGYTVEDQAAVEQWTQETIVFLSHRCEPRLASDFIEASAEDPFVPALEGRIAALDRILDGLRLTAKA